MSFVFATFVGWSIGRLVARVKEPDYCCAKALVCVIVLCYLCVVVKKNSLSMYERLCEGEIYNYKCIQIAFVFVEMVVSVSVFCDQSPLHILHFMISFESLRQ